MLALILKVLRGAEATVATMAYVFVAALLIADVLGREIFKTSFLGAEQLSVYGAIIAGFLGLTLATSDNAHLRPKVLDFLSHNHTRQVGRAGDLVSALFFLAAAYVAYSFVAVSMEAGDRAPVLYFVVWPLQFIIVYAFASAAVKHFIFSVEPTLKPAESGLG